MIGRALAIVLASSLACVVEQHVVVVDPPNDGDDGDDTDTESDTDDDPETDTDDSPGSEDHGTETGDEPPEGETTRGDGDTTGEVPCQGDECEPTTGGPTSDGSGSNGEATGDGATAGPEEG
jgi:hypothetical protein